MKKTIRQLNQSLQGKLTLWYISSISAILMTLLIAISGLFWITLQNQIDHHIHIVVTEAAQIVERFQGTQRQELLTNLVSAKGMTIVLLSPDGAPILETNSPDVAIVTEHQLQGILSSSNLVHSIPSHFTESGIRFAAVPVQVNAGKGILAVGYSTQILYSTFGNMLLIVGVTVLLCVLPITYFGYRWLKKQLEPLESISNQAKKINTSKSLTRRIQLSQPTEELATIQHTLNQMLTQLEQIFESERSFFSDAAHTLKTPLAVVRSQLENLRIPVKTKQELIKVIDSTNETIQDLLFLSKVGSGYQQTEKFSLSRLLKDLVEITATLSESKQIQVQANIQPGINIRANKHLIQRAISNVVHNAVIYNRDLGSISISLSKRSGKILITVTDSGWGVAESEQPKIFERFYRGAAGQSPGSGLGLAITKAVIENLGGTVSFSSEPGTGSTVAIQLPAK